MVKVIMGLKGSGKTKRLVDLVLQADKEETGAVVCIEKDKKLTYDIPYTVRLIQAGEYGIGNVDLFKGFIAGLHSGNYDITQVFVDNFYKIIGTTDETVVAEVLGWMDAFSNANNVKFTISISGDAAAAGEGIKKYFI
ncbi:MAG: hypothetical protein HFG45_03915 [Oscillospiraceae bacterium]|jgi:hypothetical protein|nr:hypothetical protein [Oscillospiraceae bacterium]